MDDPVLREYEHLVLPVPGVWTIDPGHSCLLFECRHMMLTPLSGWFSSFSGEIAVAEKPEDSTVEVTIDAGSLEMPNPLARDAVRGENFLESDKFRHLTFRSTAVEHVEATLWKVTGNLTIKDVSREVVLDTTFLGTLPSPPMFKGERGKAAVRAVAEFDRRDFGLDWNVPLPGGGLLVGNRVAISLDVEAVLR
jgi:polyisoprenoid-binding protein YceI